MLGWERRPAAWASRRNRRRYSSRVSRVRNSFLTVFTATTRFIIGSKQRYTRPMAPSPISRWTSWRPNLLGAISASPPRGRDEHVAGGRHQGVQAGDEPHRGVDRPVGAEQRAMAPDVVARHDHSLGRGALAEGAQARVDGGVDELGEEA